METMTESMAPFPVVHCEGLLQTLVECCNLAKRDSKLQKQRLQKASVNGGAVWTKRDDMLHKVKQGVQSEPRVKLPCTRLDGHVLHYTVACTCAKRCQACRDAVATLVEQAGQLDHLDLNNLSMLCVKSKCNTWKPIESQRLRICDGTKHEQSPANPALYDVQASPKK